MKIIFLDIDGVLNSSDTFIKSKKMWETTGNWPLEIDEFRIEYLKQIIDETGAKVVLSSSWRKDFEMINNMVEPKNEKGLEFQNILKKYNIELYDILGKQYKKTRGDLITKWLSEHGEVESFIIIDDETTELIGFIDKELIKTSFLEDGVMLKNMDDCMGLCECHVSQAINILNKKEKVLKFNKNK